MMCDPEFKDVVYTVYFANALVNLEEDELSYEQIESEVLRDFGINSENQVMQILQRLSDAFDREKEIQDK